MAHRTVPIKELKHALIVKSLRVFLPEVSEFNKTTFTKGHVMVTRQGDNLIISDGAKMILLSPHEEELLCNTKREWLFYQSVSFESIVKQF